jgi:hypothetical protein
VVAPPAVDPAPAAPAVAPLVEPVAPAALDPLGEAVRALVSMNCPPAARAVGAPAAAVLPLVPVAPEVPLLPLCRQPVTVTVRA